MVDSINPLSMLMAVVAGALLGLLYFGGLWWTLSRMSRSSRPLLLYFSSLVLRLAVVLPVFYGVIQRYDWLHLLACMAGFLCSRFLLVACSGRSSATDGVQRESI
jgi:F1F0 ATPase subunit 2